MLIVKSILYASYFLFVAYLVFIGGNDYRHLDMFSFGREINFIPFEDKVHFIASGGYSKFNDLYYFIREILGNALLFFPLPLILMLGEGITNTRKIVLVAFLSSLAIEIIQLISNLGQADIDDLMLNTLGAVAGIVFSNFVMKHKKWYDIRSFLQDHVYDFQYFNKFRSSVQE